MCEKQGSSVPHARGDEPADRYAPQAAVCVFPTHVGMNRLGKRQNMGLKTCSPRTCGMNRSRPRADFFPISVFPTHVGMNREGNHPSLDKGYVFPTHVGMNRYDPQIQGRRDLRVPHARGDEPTLSLLETNPIRCSPRTWG